MVDVGLYEAEGKLLLQDHHRFLEGVERESDKLKKELTKNLRAMKAAVEAELDCDEEMVITFMKTVQMEVSGRAKRL